MAGAGDVWKFPDHLTELPMECSIAFGNVEIGSTGRLHVRDQQPPPEDAFEIEASPSNGFFTIDAEVPWFKPLNPFVKEPGSEGGKISVQELY